MRVTITKPHDVVVLRSKAGTPLSTIAYTPTKEPVTVKREHGEELVRVGAAVEVKEPAKRATGGMVDSSKFNQAEVGKEVFEPINGSD